MYESEKKGISWYSILRKLLILILIMILVFGFVYFINSRKSASKNNDVNVKETKTKDSESKTNNQKTNKKETEKKSTNSSKDKKKTNTLSTALTQFENGALKYFNPSNLPVEENKSKTVKLQNLVNSEILKPLESKDGKKCDKNKSTTTITRLNTNYKLTSKLVCGEKTVTKTSYVGCYSNCLNNKICRGEKDGENAVCKTASTQNNQTNTNNNQSKQAENNNSNSTNNAQNNASANNAQNNASTNNASSASSNSAGSASQEQKQTKKYYKYKRCTYVPSCEVGTLNANNECVVTRTKTYTNSYGGSYQSSTNSYYAPVMKSSCEIMWSDNPNLPGWEKTNIIRYR